MPCKGPRLPPAVARFRSSKTAGFWYIRRMKFTTFAPGSSPQQQHFGFVSGEGDKRKKVRIAKRSGEQING